MVRFAADCREKMNELTQKLEHTLGPGTGDLRLQIGISSGPVTAGVLRDKKARFQLFGTCPTFCSTICSIVLHETDKLVNFFSYQGTLFKLRHY